MKLWKIVVRKNRPGPPAPVFLDWEDIGGEVSVEGSICQAAQAIDIAGRLAVEQQDTERLLQVGECFTKLADFIVALSDHKAKRDLDKKSDFPTGFQPSKQDEDEDVRDEQD